MYIVLTTVRHPETREVLVQEGDKLTKASFNLLVAEYGLTYDCVASM